MAKGFLISGKITEIALPLSVLEHFLNFVNS